MEQNEILAILNQAGKLKLTYRHCFFEGGRRESVADHSYRLALFGMLLSYEPEFRAVDMDKVIRMCLIHDLGESFTGDIPSFEKSESDVRVEDDSLHAWVASFPPEIREPFQSLLSEMEALETREAKIYKALDKLEAVLSHDESDVASWLPLEFDLQLRYGAENVEGEPYLEKMKKIIDRMTREKIASFREESERA